MQVTNVETILSKFIFIFLFPQISVVLFHRGCSLLWTETHSCKRCYLCIHWDGMLDCLYPTHSWEKHFPLWEFGELLCTCAYNKCVYGVCYHSTLRTRMVHLIGLNSQRSLCYDKCTPDWISALWTELNLESSQWNLDRMHPLHEYVFLPKYPSCYVYFCVETIWIRANVMPLRL